MIPNSFKQTKNEISHLQDLKKLSEYDLYKGTSLVSKHLIFNMIMS